MIQYKLLTPGPLTTTDTVKKEMMADHCTWDDDYKQITQRRNIRQSLCREAEASAWSLSLQVLSVRMKNY